MSKINIAIIDVDYSVRYKMVQSIPQVWSRIDIGLLDCYPKVFDVVYTPTGATLEKFKIDNSQIIDAIVFLYKLES